MQDKMTSYMAQNRMYHFEGERGVNNLEKVMKEVCGYGSDWGGTMRNFFSDNPGAIEAVLQWVSEQQSTEWTANLDALIEEEDESIES